MSRKVDLKQFERYLNSLKPQLEAELKAATLDYTLKIQELAMAKVPVDTGTLRRGINYEMFNGGTSGLVYDAVEYAVVIEFGDAYRRAQPYMFPAFDFYADKYVEECNKILEKVLKG